jgi:hypothetical protein
MFKTAALNHNACVRPTRARQLDILANRSQPAGALAHAGPPRAVLFADDDKPAAQDARPSPVAPAARSSRAAAKAATKRTLADLPVRSFSSLLADLATICLNTIQPADPAQPCFRLFTTPTPLQRQGNSSTACWRC